MQDERNRFRIAAGPIGLALAAMILLPPGRAGAQQMPYPPAEPAAKRIVTQGLATPVIDNLFKCGVPVSNHRISAVGTIKAADGTTLTVPARTDYQTAPKLPVWTAPALQGKSAVSFAVGCKSCVRPVRAGV